MLISRDSCSAVASPMVAARAGSPRCAAVAAISAALSAWSADSPHAVPSTVAVHRRDAGEGDVPPSTHTTAPTAPASRTTAASAAQPRREAVLLRRRDTASVRVQGGVERDAGAGARDRLDPAGQRVAPEQHAVGAGELAGLDDARGAVLVGPADQGHLGAGRQVEARLDDAVVAERDAEAGVRAQQGPLADRHP